MELLRAIERSFAKLHQPNHDELKQVFKELEPWLHQVPSYKSEPEQLAYGRNVLYTSSNVEAIVIYIPGKQSTTIHDHGCSIGLAYLAAGQLINTVYELDQEGYPIEASASSIRERTYFEAPAGQIHQLSNPRREPAISLHVYTPSMSNAKRYAPYSEILDYVI
ncbi:cysteine dioxygenase [Paenibacillus hexagrammi]|uniref:Cysteine dioxygenase family protein n=1 Tax=Paenibacillus hexagrammi TaxID=2908839 RepID=A0ABY3SRN7_9BACL|nr:cysteine dioxygenase family protein [Paenibacillus sp. YPD9-1]UJF36133.1 cysteine dioxygenase family protein [Paenibacillus sp. YPD9-1]